MYPKIHLGELGKAFPRLEMAARHGEISTQERSAQHPGLNPSHGGLLACSANAGILSQSQQNNTSIIWELKCVWNDKSLKWKNLIIREFLNERAQRLVWCWRFCSADDADASSSRHPSKKGVATLSFMNKDFYVCSQFKQKRNLYTQPYT